MDRRREVRSDLRWSVKGECLVAETFSNRSNFRFDLLLLDFVTFSSSKSVPTSDGPGSGFSSSGSLNVLRILRFFLCSV